MNFNQHIAKYFLNNPRLTVLCFVMLLVLGTASTVLMKTTGFPNPESNFAMVQSLYLGASSETVLNDVTIPVENALKDVDGITSTSSRSQNSVSIVSLTIDEEEDVNRVLSEIDKALSAVDLPENAEDPELNVPDIAGADYLYTLVGGTLEERYEAYKKIESKLNELPQTSKIRPQTDLTRRVEITLDEVKMANLEIDKNEVLSAITNLGEELPVVGSTTIDGDRSSISTVLPGDDLYALEKLRFNSVKLEDFASIELTYEYDSNFDPLVALDKQVYSGALTFEIYVREGSDFNSYTGEIEGIFEELENGIQIVENYSTQEQNEMQVSEVLSGLIGSELKTEGPFRYSGYLLGGIQLVFLVMVAFVSLRAAIVAALAIPLSLVFSNIYLYAIGEDFNTLVLFSLVLVIGLVVDPALVTLESIQRKKDAGFKGKEAAMEAVKDVGAGLFLATLTNVIVFFPFALVSGILGQIIRYIPLTILPAVIGSYVVPLVFLAWIGSFFLKRNKKSVDDEAENLWSAAKALRKVNDWLLHRGLGLRLFLMVAGLAVPLMLTVAMFGSGQIKSVQFAQSQNPDYLAVSGEFFPSTSNEDRELLTNRVLNKIIAHEDVEQIFNFGGELMYFINLKPADERDSLSTEMAEELNAELKDELGRFFFDLELAPLTDGPPTAAYEVALAVQSEDLTTLEDKAIELGTFMQSTCLVEEEIVFTEECSGTALFQKVDDGYTDRSAPVIEVILDRKKLAEAQLTMPNAPLSLLVNLTLRELYEENKQAIGQVLVDGEDTEIILNEDSDTPQTILEIKALEITNLAGQSIKLGDIATVRESSPKTSIQRVNGQTLAVVQGRLDKDHNDQAWAGRVAMALVDELNDPQIDLYQEGDLASFQKSFQELFIALFLAIALSYIVLAVFFESFTLPFVILYTVPLTFLGVFPGLALWGGGQFGFLEIIGLIILVGLVENVAIFLIDLAKQKIAEGWDEKDAISYASAVRLRPVILTTLTAIASLLPLAITSDQYRTLALVIMCGLLTSGITSLFTTPLLFIFFRGLSSKVRGLFKGKN